MEHLLDLAGHRVLRTRNESASLCSGPSAGMHVYALWRVHNEHLSIFVRDFESHFDGVATVRCFSGDVSHAAAAVPIYTIEPCLSIY